MTGLQIFFVIAGLIIVFILVREFFSWYWKMNEVSAKQSTTNDLLQKQNELLTANNEMLRQFIDEFTNR